MEGQAQAPGDAEGLSTGVLERGCQAAGLLRGCCGAVLVPLSSRLESPPAVVWEVTRSRWGTLEGDRSVHVETPESPPALSARGHHQKSQV